MGVSNGMSINFDSLRRTSWKNWKENSKKKTFLTIVDKGAPCVVCQLQKAMHGKGAVEITSGYA
jgi:hypothetical protein